jgi:hypothetical protein
MSARIHPDLIIEFRIAFFLGLVFLLAGIFLLFWGFVLIGVLTGLVHWFSSSQFPASIVGWLVPALCFLSGGVFFYLGRHLAMVYVGWLSRASWLLGNMQPRKMILTLPQRPGPAARLAELREEGKPETSEPSETVELRSPQWKINNLRTNVVEVFREFEPDGIVAMTTDYGIVWGFRKPMEMAYYSK